MKENLNFNTSFQPEVVYTGIKRDDKGLYNITRVAVPAGFDETTLEGTGLYIEESKGTGKKSVCGKFYHDYPTSIADAVSKYGEQVVLQRFLYAQALENAATSRSTILAKVEKKIPAECQKLLDAMSLMGLTPTELEQIPFEEKCSLDALRTRLSNLAFARMS